MNPLVSVRINLHSKILNKYDLKIILEKIAESIDKNMGFQSYDS